MLIGNQKGERVQDAKNKARLEMLESNEGIEYFEPEKKVLSRSMDECVVAKCNQWFLDYGEEKWKAQVAEYVNNGKLETYAEHALHQFKHVVMWLREWACSRHYGLGTRLPWDQDVLIESLSDSTIYFAYYTVCHMLHSDINGKVPGSLQIKAEDLTDEVFDYIFMQKDSVSPQCKVPKDKLDAMRKEFLFWYPVDLRVSGKDLIFNHLTMALYNHAAIWPDDKYWPKSYFCNGHLLIDSEKMSKSSGNFLTLTDAVSEYSADATRVALADSGDTLDNANFSRQTANAAIMRLWLLDQFAKEMTTSTQLRTGELNEADRLFINEVRMLAEKACQSYAAMQYRDALKYCYFDLTSRKDEYKLHVGDSNMHKDILLEYIEIQLLALCPIAPHICESIWSEVLKKPTLIVNTSWPKLPPHDPALHRKRVTLFNSVEIFRRARDKTGSVEPPTHAVIYVAKEYLPWQQLALKALQALEFDKNGQPPANYINTVRASVEEAGMNKKQMKETLGFASFQAKEVATRGLEALNLATPFDEMQLMLDHKDFICKSLGIQGVEVFDSENQHPYDQTERRKMATPTNPIIFFYIDDA